MTLFKLILIFIDSDIDTLCVVPRFVYRTDFFLDMLNILKNTPCITHITVSMRLIYRSKTQN